MSTCADLGSVALAVLSVATTAGTAPAEPANNACPAGYQTTTVAQAQAQAEGG